MRFCALILLVGLAFPTAVDAQKEQPGRKDKPSSRRPNPWEGAKAGSWVHYKLRTDIGGNNTESEVKFTLLEIGKDFYKQRGDYKLGNKWIKGVPTVTRLDDPNAPSPYAELDFVQDEPFEEEDPKKKPARQEKPKVERGKEKLTLPGGTFSTQWTKTTTKKGWEQVWRNKNVPCQIVKSIAVASKRKMTTILLAFEKK